MARIKRVGAGEVRKIGGVRVQVGSGNVFRDLGGATELKTAEGEGSPCRPSE